MVTEPFRGGRRVSMTLTNQALGWLADALGWVGWSPAPGRGGGRAARRAGRGARRDAMGAAPGIATRSAPYTDESRRRL
jgi:hypothetical protein